MIHMTSTYPLTFGGWAVECRCTWTMAPFDTQQQARVAGDAHIAEANAS